MTKTEKIIALARELWQAGFVSGAIAYDKQRAHHPSDEQECDTCASYKKAAVKHLHYPDDADTLTRKLLDAATLEAGPTGAPPMLRMAKREDLIATLRDMIALIEVDDSMEGVLRYEWDVHPHYAYSAFYRTGNSMGQGGSRAIPPTTGLRSSSGESDVR